MLTAQSLRKTFTLERDLVGRRRRWMTAVDGVSLELSPGRTLALVGESGCGKSTTAELVLMLQRPDSGTVTLDDTELTACGAASLRLARRSLQVVFQDPYSSLDPSQTIGSALEEPLKIHGIGDDRRDRVARVDEILSGVGLRPGTETRDRYPAELSGGQRQRIAIARALVVEPSYVVLDEAVSALDVSTQAQVVTMLQALQHDRDLGFLFISHDLGVVRHMATDVAVMYLGGIVEAGPADVIYERSRHPYTHALMDSVLEPDPVVQRARPKRVATHESPEATERLAGCAFRPRCPHAIEVCQTDVPRLRSVDGRQVACHLAEEIEMAGPLGVPAELMSRAPTS